MSREFANGAGDLSSILGRVLPKTQKWYLMPPCLTLSIIRLGSRVKWSNPEKGVAPPQHLDVVAIEKGAFVSPSTKVTNFSFTYFIMHVYCGISMGIASKIIILFNKNTLISIHLNFVFIKFKT